MPIFAVKLGFRKDIECLALLHFFESIPHTLLTDGFQVLLDEA